MSFDAFLVWGGLSVAVLDSTGYGKEVNGLFDRIVSRTHHFLKNKNSPVSRWMRQFNIWLAVEERVQAHRYGLDPIPKPFSQHPAIKDKLTPFRFLRWRGERGLAFRRTLDRFLLESVLWTFIALTLVVSGLIWTPFYFLLTAVGMQPGAAFVYTFVIGAFASIVFHKHLYRFARCIAEPIIGAGFAVTIVLLSVPLAIFRLFPTGHLSAFGLLFAALGMYRYLSSVQ